MPAARRRRLTGDAAAIMRALERRRHQLGIGREILDHQLGYTTGQLEKWVNGANSPTLFNLTTWANHLGLHLVITERSPADPFTERAYRRWLATVGRLNTAEARKLFMKLIGAK